MFGRSKKIWLLFGSFFLCLDAVASGEHEIFSQTRHIEELHSMGKEKPLPKYFVHCSVAFVKDGKVLDKRGFYENGGSVQEDPDIFTGKWEKAKTGAAPEDWAKVLEVYSRYNAGDYRLCSHNCCTVAEEAILAVTGGFVPQNIKKANHGVGTKVKFIASRVDPTEFGNLSSLFE